MCDSYHRCWKLKDREKPNNLIEISLNKLVIAFCRVFEICENKKENERKTPEIFQVLHAAIPGLKSEISVAGVLLIV